MQLSNLENGDIRSYINKLLQDSIEEELQYHKAQKRVSASKSPEEIAEKGMPEIMDPKTVTDEKGKLIYEKIPAFRPRMKGVPAFDSAAMNTPENELFGTEKDRFRHFTRYAFEHDAKIEKDALHLLAEEKQVKMMNPMNYLRDEKAKKAKYYRIRHGASDRDTSLAISALLSLMLREQGVKTDIAYPWGLTHAGDYDREELFAWIDSIV